MWCSPPMRAFIDFEFDEKYLFPSREHQEHERFHTIWLQIAIDYLFV